MRRRKTFGALVPLAVTALLVALTPATASAAPAWATRFDLFSGRSGPAVGDVFVWNDSDHVYVEIALDAGWCMSESHVALGPFPIGNPAPGQFPYQQTYATCRSTSDTYDMAYTVPTTPFDIAAHAKIWDMSSLATASVVSRVGTPVGERSDAYAEPGAAGWTSETTVVPAFAASPTWPCAQGATPAPAVGSCGDLSGAAWVSSQLAGDPFNQNHWRRFSDTLTLPGLPVPGSGHVYVNSDNYERAWMNGAVLGTDDDGPEATVENAAAEPVPTPSPQKWNTIRHWTFDPTMVNTLSIVVRNGTWAGCCGFADNPTGVIYRASAQYYARSASAWAGLTSFGGKNWATYFTYTPHGIRSNQDGNGAQFTVFGDPAWLRFSAFAGTSGDLGNLEWRWGNTPTIAFGGDITSATKSSTTGEWELVVDITTVTANGGLAGLTDACTINFYVKDGTPDTTEGWIWWSTPSVCNFGAVDSTLPLVSGFYEEF